METSDVDVRADTVSDDSDVGDVLLSGICGC